MTDLLNKNLVQFPSELEEILQRIESIAPIKYGQTRNYIDGTVTYLSPYISRGVISTKFILSQILKQGFTLASIEKFVQELAWREYWQNIWIVKNNEINSDLKQEQHPVSNIRIPKAVVKSNIGIEAIDKAISLFYETGYIHNHMRMYIAAITCSIGQSHWKLPAQWMYYHLLDADWASNALSWQWVAGTNSNKKYYTNQENINKFCYTNQKNTFLDVDYDTIQELQIPDTLRETIPLVLKTPLPKQLPILIDDQLPTLLYNFYNLDPYWKKNVSANRILLLEPSHFKQYPISQKTIDFILALSKNIKEIQVFIGEFNELVTNHNIDAIFYKEHPLNNHYKGIEEPRDWMFTVKDYYPSFFSFWKKCKKELML